jgi:hypothetical protein
MFRLNRNKQKTNRNSLTGSKFCYFFTENVVFSGLFRFFVFFGFYRFVSKQFVSVVSLLYQNREFRCFDWTETKEDPPKQFKREDIWVFFRKFRVVSVYFSLLRNSSVCFGCFDIVAKHRNKPKFFIFGFTKQTETNAKQIFPEPVVIKKTMSPSSIWKGLKSATTYKTPCV